MAGRGLVPPQHVFPDGGRRMPDGLPFPRGPPLLRPPPPAVYEEEIELQIGEIRRLAGDNRRLLEDCEGLQRELAMAKEEIRRLNVLIADVRVDKEVQMRDLIEKGKKVETELRAAAPLRNEVLQLRAEAQRLSVMRQEQVLGIRQELTRVQADAKQVPALKGEIDALMQELMRARTTLDYEKKGNAEMVDQRQAMEKNLVSIARELEKLRAELASGKARNRVAGGAYGVKLNSPEAGFPLSYGDAYGLHSVPTDKAPLYGMGSGSWGAYDKSRLARH